MNFVDVVFAVFVLLVIYCAGRIFMIWGSSFVSDGWEDGQGFHYGDPSDLPPTFSVTRQADCITVPIEHIRGDLARGTPPILDEIVKV